jgi:hypothetical protein
MGSDMYAHVEYKPRTPSPHHGYEHFAEVYIERDYRLFALIGGKQYSDVVEPLYSFRGLPKDMSSGLKTRHEIFGGTSIASWINLTEVKNVLEWHENLFVNDANRAVIPNHRILKAIIRVMEFFEEDNPNSTRLVFWFD